MDFEACHAQRMVIEFGGITFPLICPEDLIANKAAVGRKQDLADIEQIEKYLRNNSVKNSGEGVRGSKWNLALENIVCAG